MRHVRPISVTVVLFHLSGRGSHQDDATLNFISDSSCCTVIQNEYYTSRLKVFCFDHVLEGILTHMIPHFKALIYSKHRNKIECDVSHPGGYHAHLDEKVPLSLKLVGRNELPFHCDSFSKVDLFGCPFRYLFQVSGRGNHQDDATPNFISDSSTRISRL